MSRQREMRTVEDVVVYIGALAEGEDASASAAAAAVGGVPG